MRKSEISFSEVNRLALPYIRAILRRLLPNGTVEGNEYIALNPHRADKNRGSFRINLRTGKWADFATVDKGGDIISLYAFVCSVTQIEAANAILDMLGVAYHD